MTRANEESPSAAEVAPQPGSDFYYASLYLAPNIRHAVSVLEACRREVACIPQTCSDRGVAHVKLAWWREEFERVRESPPRHQITRALAALAVTNPDLIDIFATFVERVDASLSEPKLASRVTVMDAIRNLYGDIFRQFVLVSGTYDLDTVARLVELACCIERAYELVNLRQHRRGGVLFIAQDALARYRLSVDAIRQAARSTDIRELVRDELENSLQALHSACAELPRALRREQRLLCTLACILQRVLRLTLDADCPVLEQRIELTPVHKLWIAWRTRVFG